MKNSSVEIKTQPTLGVNLRKTKDIGFVYYLNDIDKVKQTMIRFMKGLAIATDPNAEREEYISKLYKILQVNKSDKKSNQIDLFVIRPCSHWLCNQLHRR